jgi:predicted PurR-regulated permease PerM
MVLADIDFWNVFWAILWLFFLVIWIMILFNVLIDLFRDHGLSGWAKALWVVFVIFLPFLAVLVYLIVRGGGMAQRSAAQQRKAQGELDEYVRSVAGGGAGPAEQIAKAKELLDSGAIDQAEYDRLKAKALG